MYGKMSVGNWYGLRQLAAELVFSAGWNPWAVAGCSLLDAKRYISAVYA
ncbi:hypothetical protein [uncultured Robinsoniella sp.]